MPLRFRLELTLRSGLDYPHPIGRFTFLFRLLHVGLELLENDPPELFEVEEKGQQGNDFG